MKGGLPAFFILNFLAALIVSQSCLIKEEHLPHLGEKCLPWLKARIFLSKVCILYYLGVRGQSSNEAGGTTGPCAWWKIKSLQRDETALGHRLFQEQRWVREEEGEKFPLMTSFGKSTGHLKKKPICITSINPNPNPNPLFLFPSSCKQVSNQEKRVFQARSLSREYNKNPRNKTTQGNLFSSRRFLILGRPIFCVG